MSTSFPRHTGQTRDQFSQTSHLYLVVREPPLPSSRPEPKGRCSSCADMILVSQNPACMDKSLTEVVFINWLNVDVIMFKAAAALSDTIKPPMKKLAFLNYSQLSLVLWAGQLYLSVVHIYSTRLYPSPGEGSFLQSAHLSCFWLNLLTKGKELAIYPCDPKK